MVKKTFCDRCGKEIKNLYRDRVRISIDHHLDLCKKCKKKFMELVKNFKEEEH